jgi:tRNA-dihydrouridine synthase A
MVTTGALLHGPRERLLRYHPDEQPLAVQLGGSDPQELAQCSRIAERCGFAEVNLNVGCPSDRVRSGRFGACLMAVPDTVAECVAAMRAAVSIPVTVKCRVGIDDMEDYRQFEQFVATVAAAGCDTFIVHARKAWLQGLSPKENREVPPLKYDYVYRLKRENPGLQVVLNGGVTSLDQAQAHLEHVDGVMMGREAYHNPYLLAAADRRFYGDTGPERSREAVIEAFSGYMRRELASGTPLNAMTRHALGLYKHVKGSASWKRYISGHAHLPSAGADILQSAYREGVGRHPGDRG